MKEKIETMSRVKRGLCDGSIYHVLDRGIRKEGIFHKEQDFWVFTELVKEAKKLPVPIFACVFIFSC
jgi:putative transposase